jgi:hypothetical protein
VKNNIVQYSVYLAIGVMLVLQSTAANENNQLIAAVKDRNINDVRSLLKKRVDVNQPELMVRLHCSGRPIGMRLILRNFSLSLVQMQISQMITESPLPILPVPTKAQV